jgi:enoyl-CoA hydratase
MILQEYETFLVKVIDSVAHVRFNRPKKANALNEVAWQEMRQIFDTLDAEPSVRAIILSGEGKNFCSGIDLAMLMTLQPGSQDACAARTREHIRKFILDLQSSITAIENCRKPVLAAIQNACIGGAVDIISACDMRYATEDAFVAIAEVDMGLVADLGTMQRLPKLIPDGVARELAFTGRRMYAEEAQSVGLVNKVYENYETMMADVTEIARMIASKSPVVMRGTKHILNHSRDHSVSEGLQYMATWNAGLILSNDLNEAFMAKMQNRQPQFAD